MRSEMNKQTTKGSIQFKVNSDADTLHLKTTPFGVLLEMDECITAGEPGGPGIPTKIVRVAGFVPIGDLSIRSC